MFFWKNGRKVIFLAICDRSLKSLGWWYWKVKIVQECKEPKVEMYKSIWGLMFKCNGSGIQFKSIQFSQEYSNQKMWEKKSKDKQEHKM
jgi:hypothetical protein